MTDPADNAAEEGILRIPVDSQTCTGDFVLPDGAQGIVVLTHSSGSSRFIPESRYIAEVLQEAGLATVLIDLLTEEEEMRDQITCAFRTNIRFMTDRLAGITDWLNRNPQTGHLPLGYFGTGTGAAWAFMSAAQNPKSVNAIVSYEGRPDLAGTLLPNVLAPSLFIINSEDHPVLPLTRDAVTEMERVAKKELVITPKASRFYEETARIEKVAELARDWFLNYLVTIPVT